MTDKILVNCSSNAKEIEQATISFIVANAAVADDNETVLFLTDDSVRLATKGGAEGFHAKGHEPIQTYISSFVENGGKIWVCPACANPRGITPDQLIDGAELRGALPMVQFAKEAVTVL